eukprot:2793477-Rhodomonas_salina.1
MVTTPSRLSPATHCQVGHAPRVRLQRQAPRQPPLLPPPLLLPLRPARLSRPAASRSPCPASPRARAGEQ